MADGDRAAVDIHHVRADAQVAHGLQGHDRERLVDLDQIQVGHGPARLGQGLLDGVGRLGVQRVVGAGHVPVRPDLGDDVQPGPFGKFRGRHHDGGRTVRDLRGGPGRDRAVLAEGRPEPGQRLGRGARADALVLGHGELLAFVPDRDAGDLGGEQAVLGRRRRALVGPGGELVLLLAGDAELAPAPLGGLAHGQVVEGVGQPVERHRVLDRDRPVLVAGPGVQQQVRRPGHGLHPARHHHVVLAQPDQLRRECDGVQAGQAHFVHRQRWNGHADARRDRGLPGGDLPGARLQHLAHDHVLHLVRGYLRAVEGGRDRDAAQVAGRLAGEGPEQAADRRPGAADDDRLT